jgi:hypothetical protein
MAAILHKVKRGETIMSICLIYSLPYEQFVKLNMRFLGIGPFDMVEARVGDPVVVGDSADPIDLVRVLRSKGEL